MEECIFCKIAKGAIKNELAYEDADFIAFDDINPKAPVHVLVVPKKHIPSIENIPPSQFELIGKMTGIARNLAAAKNLEGYKLIFNVGEKGGQLIAHLHLHLLGGWGESPKKVEV